jgi:transposase
MKITRKQKERIIRLFPKLCGNVKIGGEVLLEAQVCIERMFRRLKAFRRTATRYDKLDLMFFAFIYLALCIIIGCSLGFLCVNAP